MPPKSSMVGPQLSILCFLSSAIKTILKVYMYVSMKKKVWCQLVHVCSDFVEGKLEYKNKV
jgi:hypothetical protein